MAAGPCSPTARARTFLEADATLDGPEGNVVWNKRIGALPIYKSAREDPFYANPKFKGWFAELGDKDVTPTVMPLSAGIRRLPADAIVVKTSQQALARPALAEGYGQAMGRLPDHGAEEYLRRQEVT